MSKGQANLIAPSACGPVWVWGTRIWNIWGDDTARCRFKAVHTVLAVISVAFAVAVWLVVRRTPDESDGTPRPGRQSLACAAVGQPVAVTPLAEQPARLLRFEANRSLTGMGHEHYTSLDQAVGPGSLPPSPAACCQTGQVDSVHVYGNIVTVDLHKGYTGDSLSPIIEDPVHLLPRGLRAPAPRAAGRGGARGGGGDGAARRRAVLPSTPACRPTCSSAAVRPRNAGCPSRAEGRPAFG
jgi:hypothetical protein